MSKIFLFGAGASYGSGDCLPSPPPLGSNLLTEMRKEGGVAASITGELLEEFNKDPEKGMVKFFRERNTETTQLLKEMSAFLAKYKIGDNNVYVKLINKIKDKKGIVLATTNYDLLIEQAISRTDKFIQYSGDEIIKDNVLLLKIHGSSNFIPSASVTGVSFNLSENYKGSIIGGAPKILFSPDEVINYCNSDTSLAPAIAMYHPEKRLLYCADFVKYIQETFKEYVLKSSKIFIIGLKIHPTDKHIWSELEKTKADIYIIDKDKSSHLEWMKQIKKKNIYHLADTFENSLDKIFIILNIKN